MNNHLILFTLFLLLSGWIAPTAEAQLAAGQPKFLGNILKGFKDKGMTDDPLFLQYWNQATPENAGKHGLFETSRDTYQSQALDEMYAYCQANNLPFKQHTFLFWCCGADADWLEGLSSAEIREEMEEWIIYFFDRYPNTAYAEVVNEPFQSPPPAAIRDALGGDADYAWVRWMYAKAREHAPADCELWINENNVLKGGSRVSRYGELIRLLQADGTLDAVGMQGHWLEDVPASTIQNTLNQLGGLNLPLYITEYEVNRDDMNAQRDIWAAQFPVFWEHPAVKGVTLWGYREGQMWRDQGYLVRADGSERPALQWLRAYLQGDTPDDGDNMIEIRAKGTSGSEQMELRIDGRRVESWVVGTDYANYTALAGEGSVEVAFVNDSPDRDLRVDYLRTNGTTYQAEDQVVNTGAWSNGSCGGSYSEWIYCSGYIDFGSLNSESRTAPATSGENQALVPSVEDRLIIYPNPAQHTVAVRISSEHATIQLMNQGGHVLKEITADGKDKDVVVDISELPTGMYLLATQSLSGQRVVQKFVVE